MQTKKLIAIYIISFLVFILIFSFPMQTNAKNEIWNDDLENTDGWSYDGFWHLINDTNPYYRANSPTHSFWYGQDTTGNYDNGQRNMGNLTTPTIDLTYVSNAYLEFWYWYETETNTDYDKRIIQINDGSGWKFLSQLKDDKNRTWLKKEINISSYVGKNIQIRFFFDTVNAINNNYLGWYIDDIFIYEKKPTAFITSIFPNPARQGQTINFSGEGEDDRAIVEYEWISSIDGKLSDSASFSLSNLSIGKHNISFRVKNDRGIWSDYSYEELTIVKNQLPIIYSFIASKIEVKIGEEINFQINAIDYDGTIIEYYFDFGDGASSSLTTNSVIYSYREDGNYTVKARVKDDNNEESLFAFIKIKVGKNKLPIINSFTPTKYNALIGEEITFTVSAIDIDGTIKEYYYDFGDGRIYNWSSENEVKHNYSSEGKYIVKVRVKDNDNGISEKTIEINIRKSEEQKFFIQFFEFFLLIALILFVAVIKRKS